MVRVRSATLFALFALFCGPLAGSAVAASGTSPVVSGDDPPAIGAQLTATPANAVDSTAWESCGTYQLNDAYPLTGAVNQPYTLSAADIGTNVCAIELSPGLLTVDGISDPIGPPGLSAAGASLTQGQTISVTPGAWGSGVPPADIWEVCDASGANCQPIPGATGTSYTVTRSDVGLTIDAAEAQTAGGEPSVTMPPTGVVRATPATIISPPTVSGTAQVGDTLTVSPGTWTNQPTSYTYQWERCSAGVCSGITGATNATYTPSSADAEDTLEVLVTAYVVGVGGSPYPSYPTGVVAGVSSSPPSTPGPSPVVPVTSLHAIGRLTATMLWTFRYAPKYTQIAALAVQGPALGSTIATRCTGKGCPFTVHRIKVRGLERCRARSTGHCRAPHKVNLERRFRGHHLAVGTQVMVMISRRHDIGKYYRFVVRRRRSPSVKISCIAPGSTIPGKNCTGV